MGLFASQFVGMDSPGSFKPDVANQHTSEIIVASLGLFETVVFLEEQDGIYSEFRGDKIHIYLRLYESKPMPRDMTEPITARDKPKIECARVHIRG
jgi:hypothetical protein